MVNNVNNNSVNGSNKAAYQSQNQKLEQVKQDSVAKSTQQSNSSKSAEKDSVALTPQAKQLKDLQKKITDSEGAEAGYTTQSSYLHLGSGFSNEEHATYHHLSASFLAGAGETKQRGGYGTSALRTQDLLSLEEVAEKAVKRAVRALNPRKVISGSYPVVFESSLVPQLLQLYLEFYFFYLIFF